MDFYIYELVFWTTSGKVFLGPRGHLNIRNPICVHIHVNIRTELVFHTTSGASIYLNVASVCIYIYIFAHIQHTYTSSEIYKKCQCSIWMFPKMAGTPKSFKSLDHFGTETYACLGIPHLNKTNNASGHL